MSFNIYYENKKLIIKCEGNINPINIETLDLVKILKTHPYAVKPTKNQIEITLRNQLNNEKLNITGWPFDNSYENISEKIRISYKRIERKLIDDFEKTKSNLTIDESERYRSLLHLIQFYSLEQIVIVNSLTMFNIARSLYNIEDKEININEFIPEEKTYKNLPVLRKVELMGCCINETKIIYLCPENMYHFKKQDGLDNYSIDNFIDAVLSHEIGHLIFSYMKDDEYPINPNEKTQMMEKQANYFSSYIFDSYYDHFIDAITTRQLKQYHNPLLLSHKLKNTLKEYNKEVNELYGGILNG